MLWRWKGVVCYVRGYGIHYFAFNSQFNYYLTVHFTHVCHTYTRPLSFFVNIYIDISIKPGLKFAAVFVDDETGVFESLIYLCYCFFMFTFKKQDSLHQVCLFLLIFFMRQLFVLSLRLPKSMFYKNLFLNIVHCTAFVPADSLKH